MLLYDLANIAWQVVVEKGGDEYEEQLAELGPGAVIEVSMTQSGGGGIMLTVLHCAHTMSDGFITPIATWVQAACIHVSIPVIQED